MFELAASKKTILVVDDDKSILRTFTRILQKSGYEIVTAETGKEAIEKAELQHYDLALVDLGFSWMATDCC
jgi:CheY-like chemotaxis protein